MNTYRKKPIAWLLGLCLAGAAPTSWATLIGSFNTSGTTDGGAGNVSATALFDLTGNTLTLTLTNTTSSIERIAEVLDGFRFTLSTGSLTLTSVTAQGGELDCTGGGGCAVSQTGPITDDVSPFFDWIYPANSNPNELAPNGYKPHGIVNDTTTVFDGIPNGQHNPYLLGPVDFSFLFSGSGTPTISSVAFLWGTEQELTPGQPIQPPTIPEPNILALFGIGLLGAKFTGKRPKRSRPSSGR